MRRFRLSRRHRLRCIAAMVFALLFQQLAMAAYVCAQPATSAMAMRGDCAQMHGTAPHAADPRCTEHCADHASASPVAQAPSVPALPPFAVPPVEPGTVLVNALPAGSRCDPALASVDPPPTLRFCSLLI